MRAIAVVAFQLGLLFLEVGQLAFGQHADGTARSSRKISTANDSAGIVQAIKPIGSPLNYRIAGQAINGQGFGVAKLTIENILADDETWVCCCKLDRISPFNSKR